MRRKQLSLSQLVSSRSNPRRVKPDREAHARLVASMRTFGFFSSLVVKSTDDEERFIVVAHSGQLVTHTWVRRGADNLAACIVLHGEADKAPSMSVAENFEVRPPTR